MKKKQHAVPNVCQNRRPYRTLFQFSASPSSILDTTENATFAHFMKKIHAFEDWIFVRFSRIVLASEWTTNRNKFIVYSIDLDRFMTSEGSDMLILPFTSLPGQSVAQKRQWMFLIWVLLVKRGHILTFYMSNFRLQT